MIDERNMGGKDYNVDFITHNFKPGDLEPMKVWKQMKDEYVTLLNDYTRLENDHIGPLNEVWKARNPHNEDDEITDWEKWNYGVHLLDAFNVLAFIVAQNHPDFYLCPFVFYGKEGPKFGCRIKQHPEMNLWIEHQDKA